MCHLHSLSFRPRVGADEEMFIFKAENFPTLPPLDIVNSDHAVHVNSIWRAVRHGHEPTRNALGSGI